MRNFILKMKTLVKNNYNICRLASKDLKVFSVGLFC